MKKEMKKYKVNVNGTVYEVAVEAIDGAAASAPVAAAPAAPAAGGYSRPAVQDAAPSYSAGSSEDFAVIDDNEDLPF